MQPLAIVFYERLMPGSQLVNRLQDLNYRVLTVNNIDLLAATAKRESPILLLADLDSGADVCGVIGKIKSDSASSHLPVIAFAPDNRPELLAGAESAGADFTVGETAIASHLPQLVDRALHVE
jgi:CheY-like chemotaxis protein